MVAQKAVLGFCISFTISYFTLNLLQYLQFYCSSGKTLLWPSIQARRSLLSPSDIFSEGTSLSARVTELGAHMHFFLSGHPVVTFVSEEQPSSSSVLFPMLDLLGSRGPG